MLRPQSPTAVRVDTHTTITSRVSFADQLQPGGRAFLRSCEVRRSLSLSLYPQPRADSVFSAAVDDQAPAYDGQLGELLSRCATSSRGKALTLRCTVTRASMLAVARLHTIDIELVNEERHVHLVHLVRPLLAGSSCSSSQPSRSRPADEVRTAAQVNGFGGMRLVTSFVTFFLDHLVPALGRAPRRPQTAAPPRPPVLPRRRLGRRRAQRPTARRPPRRVHPGVPLAARLARAQRRPDGARAWDGDARGTDGRARLGRPGRRDEAGAHVGGGEVGMAWSANAVRDRVGLACVLFPFSSRLSRSQL